MGINETVRPLETVGAIQEADGMNHARQYSAGTSGERMKALGFRRPEGLTVTCLCGHPKHEHRSKCHHKIAPGIECGCGEYMKKR
jgi:hypothetical protein